MAVTTGTVNGALDERERAALTAVAIGLSHEQAARRVGLSERRFRRILAHAVAKLGATETIHAVALAALTGEIDPAHVRARTCPVYPEPVPQEIRAWAREKGIDCPPRGKVPAHVHTQYEADLLASRRRSQ